MINLLIAECGVLGIGLGIGSILILPEKSFLLRMIKRSYEKRNY